MGVVIEILLIAILCGGMIFGFVRGFVKSVAKPVQICFALFITVVFSSSFGENIIQPLLQNPIENRIAVHLESYCENISEDNLPTVVKLSAAICDVDLSGYIGESGEETAAKISAAVSDPVCRLVSRVTAFVFLYLICLVAAAFLLKLVDHLFKVGPLNVLNRLLGVLFGAAFAVVFAWVFCSFFNFLLSTNALVDRAWVVNFKGGAVYRFFKEFDPLEMLLSF